MTRLLQRLRAEEAGTTVVELGVAALVSLLVLGASLSVFEAMTRQDRATREHNEAQDRARTASDRLARELRNLASPSDQLAAGAGGTTPDAVERNLPYDLVYKTVGDTRPAGSTNTANVARVRYCLQTTGTADPATGVLWRQTQQWTTAGAPPVPADTACPGAGWDAQQVTADAIVNRIDGRERPVFRYSGEAGAITGTDLASRKQISRVESTVFVDPDPRLRATEATLTSSVLLRNQNREPVADFTQEVVNSTTCTVLLNGSASADPESQPLRYQWFWNGDLIHEEGIVVHKAVGPGVHSFELRVYDPANLEGISTPKDPITCAP